MNSLLQIILVAFMAVLAGASAQSFRHFFAGFGPYVQTAVMRDPRSNRGKLFLQGKRQLHKPSRTTTNLDREI
jgi:hypothetical protein